jgi:hypothetical protein
VVATVGVFAVLPDGDRTEPFDRLRSSPVQPGDSRILCLLWGCFARRGPLCGGRRWDVPHPFLLLTFIALFLVDILWVFLPTVILLL